ncbi:WD-40 repeat protein [Calothrix sp. NIES-4101]|nr:WD-40 repeat protein [Calothrix sp. NIES-4101]
MNTVAKVSNCYQVGGSLPLTATTYVLRQADEELYRALTSGRFCYVLNSRQMGKSSLRVRTMRRLAAEGFTCCAIEMRDICGYGVTPDEFFGGFLSLIVSGFDLEIDVGEWWRKNEYISPLLRLSKFVEEKLLNKCISQPHPQKIIIFVDEIDNLINLEFKDDFFAFVRSCYNKRADNYQYNCLTFALLGVATPTDLIADNNLTPFNIDSQAVELTGLELEQATPLEQGFVGIVNNPEVALQDVLHWTGGQPFLTQWLCQILCIYSSTSVHPDSELGWVAKIVREKIIDNWWTQDKQQHLQTIKERLLSNESQTCRLLGLYQQILQEGEIIADDSREQIELRLSGLVVKQEGILKVYNRIYESVFNQDWVEQELKKIRPDFYTDALIKWEASGCQNTDYLLKGDNLELALGWANSKKLTDLDYQFIADSQNLAIQQFEIALDNAEKELNIANLQTKNAQQQVNHVAGQIKLAKRQLKRTMMAGSISIIGMILIAIGWAKEADFYARKADEEKENVKLAQIETQQVQQEFLQAIAREKLATETAHLAEQQQKSFQKQAKEAENLAINAQRRRDQAEAARVNAQRQAKYLQALAQQAQIRREQAEIAQEDAQKKADISEKQRERKEQELAETQVINLSSSAQAILSENPFDALLKVLEAAQKLKTLEKIAPIEGKTKLAVKSTLQQILFVIRERDRLQSHQGAVRSVSFSPDGKYLASGGEDDTVKLWNRQGFLLFTFNGHNDNIWQVTFSPNSKILASASDDGTVKLWDVENHRLIRTIHAHSQWVRSVIFSQDGKVLASSSSDGSIKLWNTENGKLLKTLKQHRGWVTHLSLSPDGKTLASAGADRTVKLWDFATGDLLKNLKGHKGNVRSVAFRPDGKILASGSEDNSIKLWNLENGQELETIQEYRTSIWSVVFSPDGKTLAALGADSTIKLQRVDNIKDVSTDIQVLKGHQGRIWSVAFSPDGKTLASGSVDETVKLWNLETKVDTYASGNNLISVSISPDGKLIASAGNQGMIELRDMQNKQLLFTFKHEPNKAIRSIRFSTNGKFLASASDDKTVRLWDVKNRRLFQTLVDGYRYSSVRFSPDGKTIATKNSKIIKLWNIQDGTAIRVLKDTPDKHCVVRDINFHPNGKTLGVACSYGNMQIWDVITGSVLLNIKGHSSHISSISFSPNGKILASGGTDSKVKLWNVNNGQLIKKINAHQSDIRRVTFSPDGKILASTGDDMKIKLWKVSDGSLLNELWGHQGRIISLSFTPDSKIIASASSDNTFKIWNLDDNLDNFIQQSCSWLSDYFLTHPESREKIQVCHQDR